MAVVFLFRAAIYLAERGTVSIYTASGAGAGASLSLPGAWLHERLTAGDSDAEVSAALSERIGYAASVATYNEPFELRRMQVSFSQQDALVASDDVRVLTIDLVKLSAGAPTNAWVAQDFTNAKARFATFWTALKPYFASTTVHKSIKFYKLGPDVLPPQPPVNAQDYAVAGTSAWPSLPPQVALTVTEKAGSKPFWGRFYLPAPSVSDAVVNVYGRPPSALLTIIGDAADVMYEGFKTDGIPAVVYRRPLPIRQKKDGTELPARDGSAWTVEQLQVDDVFDVIRSRRWKIPTLRLQRDVTQP